MGKIDFIGNTTLTSEDKIDLSGSKILIIDDSLVSLQILEDELLSDNYDVRSLDDPTLAMEVLEGFPADLLILDVNMPVIDGLELAKMVRENPSTSDIALIFITGEFNAEKILKCFELGGDYAAKPIRSYELFTRVKVALTTRELKNKTLDYASKLKESEELLNKVIDESPAQIFVQDVKQRFIHINKQFLNVTGLSHDEVYMRSTDEIRAAGRDVSILECLTEAHLGGSRASFESFYTIEGETYWVFCRRVHFYHADGICTLGINLDISTIKHEQKVKTELLERLAQSQKMETVGTMAGGIAHDFNNLLAIILGFTEMAMRDLNASISQKESLNEVITAGKTARDLVQQILDFSKKPRIELEKVDLIKIINDSISLSGPSCFGINVNLNGSYEILYIDGNPTRLNQLFFNLYTNACHAMPNGGNITIDVGLNYFKMCPNCKEPLTGEYVLIKFSDEGEGIGIENQERVFEPYFTTKGIGEGTGLGLSIVHSVIDQHNGHICIDSAPKEGSTFYIILPIISDNGETELCHQVMTTEKE